MNALPTGSDTLLRGMTWSHARGIDPLVAGCAASGIAVDWDARSLADFEDYPVPELARRYDLIAVDHPFMGEAARTGCLLPLDEYVDAALLDAHRRDTIGPAGGSYHYAGHQWALAMDAAAPVAAWRHGVPMQRTDDWAQVIALLEDAAGGTGGLRAMLPANPTHLYSTFISLCHAVAAPDERAPAVEDRPGWWPASGIDNDVVAAALLLVRRLLGLVHPDSLGLDPIGVLDRMGTDGDVDYVPLVFGYVSYAHEGFRPQRIRFTDAPGGTGTMTGGVGLAVSARCRGDVLTQALQYAEFVTSPGFQAGGFVRAGGQPAHVDAWRDPAANELTADFFAATTATVGNGFLRARDVGYNRFQQHAGELLHRGVMDGTGDAALVAALTQAWRDR